jgi:hypothetical protein
LFPGEDHGFRSADNIIRSFEAELSFYGQVFGFTPADKIEAIRVEFLDSGPAINPEGADSRPASADSPEAADSRPATAG